MRNAILHTVIIFSSFLGITVPLLEKPAASYADTSCIRADSTFFLDSVFLKNLLTFHNLDKIRQSKLLDCETTIPKVLKPKTHTGDECALQIQEELENLTQSYEHTERARAAFNLSQIGLSVCETTIHELVSALQNSSGESELIRVSIIQAIGMLGAEGFEALPTLLEHLQSSNNLIENAQIVRTLGQISLEGERNVSTDNIIRAVEILENILKPSTCEDIDFQQIIVCQSMRTDAAYALGQLGMLLQDTYAVETLISVFQETECIEVDPVLQENCINLLSSTIYALHQIGLDNEDYLFTLIDVLIDTDPLRSGGVSYVLENAHLNEQVLQKLISVFKSGNANIKYKVARIIGEHSARNIEDIKTLSILIESLQSSEFDTKLVILNSVEKWLTATSNFFREDATNFTEEYTDVISLIVRQLSNSLDDTNQDVVISSTYLLGQIGNHAEAPVSRLVHLLEDSNYDTRLVAIFALGEIANQRDDIISKFSDILNARNIFDEKRREQDVLRSYAAIYLGYAGLQAEIYITDLVEIISNPIEDKVVRQSCLIALQDISLQGSSLAQSQLIALEEREDIVRSNNDTVLKVIDEDNTLLQDLDDDDRAKPTVIRKVIRRLIDRFRGG